MVTYPWFCCVADMRKRARVEADPSDDEEEEREDLKDDSDGGDATKRRTMMTCRIWQQHGRAGRLVVSTRTMRRRKRKAKEVKEKTRSEKKGEIQNLCVVWPMRSGEREHGQHRSSSPRRRSSQLQQAPPRQQLLGLVTTCCSSSPMLFGCYFSR
jgi:hypothetical protein